MNGYVLIGWDSGNARIKAFSSASRSGKSTVKIEIEVSDPYTLGHILSDLQKAQRDQDKAPSADFPSAHDRSSTDAHGKTGKLQSRKNSKQIKAPEAKLLLTYRGQS